MTSLEIDLTLVARTPLSVGAGGSAGSLADKSILRDGWGRPLIPGSQLKGKARHAAERLLIATGQPVPAHFDDRQTASAIRMIFGAVGGEGSRLRFADLIGMPSGMPEQWRPDQAERHSLGRIRPSVSLNRRRHTAEEARLLFQEVALEGLVFTSLPKRPAVSGALAQLEHAALLWAALRLVGRWGGASSRGLGWADATVTLRWGGTPLEDGELEAALRRLLSGEVA